MSIVIPAYNEEKRIGVTLETYTNYFNALLKHDWFDYEIIVVINNTKDNTEEVVMKAQAKNKRILYLNLIQGGKGFAVIEGFKNALSRKNDIIGFLDADMSTPPEALHDLIKKIYKIDGAIASRYIKGSVVEPKPTLQRLLASRIFNFLIRSLLLMPYRDTQCGAKVFKRKPLKEILPKLSLSQWAFDAEILYQLRKSGFTVREFPTRWSDKEYSKIHLAKAGPSMALSIIRLRLINSPFKDFLRLYNKLYTIEKIINKKFKFY